MSLVPPNPAADLVESEEVCTAEHCLHAFDALYCALTPSAIHIAPKFPDEKYPLFVTWNTRSSRLGRSHRLRGCIGSFEPHPLHEGLAEYALISAFRDSRFRKISKSELSSLECVVSLLTDFEDADSYLDWTIGVHGIYISFPHPSTLLTSSSDSGLGSGAPSPLSSSSYLPRITSKQTFTATYLPEVMPEQGWDKIDAIDSAIQKAGWNGSITEDIRRSIKLRRYQSRKYAVGWDEYVEWRKGQGHHLEN
ncbi:AMMECR1 domain-containing protein [Rhodocollybia butyracea]|uniref:AMMECR1 domain-containing protein n=1 Tax=Rhodocollybia butyracea TaxID=206335 RepID=A0A9P5UES8_9AGAR|nr:AMMECR1 domain-containing protein [Rhodocollybia butyracea]